MADKTLTQPAAGSANNNGAVYESGVVTKAATDDLMNDNYSNSTVGKNTEISGTNTLPNDALVQDNSGTIPTKQTDVATGKVVNQDSLIS